MKNSVFSCLTAWLKTENFEGKRRFVRDKNGLGLVGRLVFQVVHDEGNFNPRLRLNIHRLLHDLVLNDDDIFEE